MSQEEEERWINTQIEQQKEDQDQLKSFYDEQENDCPHNYERLEILPTGQYNSYDELFVCIHCGNEKVITHSNRHEAFE